MTPSFWHAAPHFLALALALVLGATSPVAQAACPTWPTGQRFVLNGGEATDTHTGLVWARCSKGQSWSGSTCTGTATPITHEAALVHARVQTGWRLPTVKELASLADKGCINPAIDSTAFPATQSNWHWWTSSPYADNSSYAWLVSFNHGGVNTSLRDYDGDGSFVVRLVRASH